MSSKKSQCSFILILFFLYLKLMSSNSFYVYFNLNIINILLNWIFLCFLFCFFLCVFNYKCICINILFFCYMIIYDFNEDLKWIYIVLEIDMQILSIKNNTLIPFNIRVFLFSFAIIQVVDCHNLCLWWLTLGGAYK